MSGAGLFAVFLLVTVGGGLLLYLLVRSEHDQRRPMDRESAEKAARRDLPDDESRDGGGRDDERWDTEREKDRFR